MDVDTPASAGRRAGSSLDTAQLNTFHVKLALVSSGGPFLDGYILGIIGIAMVQIQTQWRMSILWSGLIGASALIGVFVGGAVFGAVTDRIGRKLMFMIDLIAIIVCSVLQFFVTNEIELFVLRLLIGIAVGADYPIATSLVTEFAPKAWRAKLLGGLNAMWFVGATVAAFVGYLLLSSPDGWKWMLASSAIPAAVIVCARARIPESPRWLHSKGRTQEAVDVLRQTVAEHATLADLPEEEGAVPMRALLTGGYLKRVVFISVFWTCTIVTLFAIYAFGPQVLALFNLNGGDEANLGYGLINLFFLIGNVVALLLVDRLGRRPVLIGGFAVSALGLLYLAVAPDSGLWMVAFAFAVYAVFNGGPSILEWIYPNELFPTEVRATAVGLCTGISRIGSAIGTFATPWSLASLGLSATMYIAAGIALVGALVSFFMAPETKNKDLHVTSALT
ncbi:MFS transporter [Streptomyces sp. NBC_01306]|uniref:MFS transporter n=1 Tax=Streptomyces sp. NBC_01306 TaxID=2903819 RepID=UPI00225B4721|nr:MFS transporter [Streptomyces sp. NBC_01306]MCX4728879.1 MFS transporter [Streptomyces sp. NBC_01306]